MSANKFTYFMLIDLSSMHPILLQFVANLLQYSPAKTAW